MRTKTILLTILNFAWAILLALGVNFANPPVFSALLERYPGVHNFVVDIFSDATWLFVAFIPAVCCPRFFGYQMGSIGQHRKMLLWMLAFFAGAPLIYRLLAGGTPFSANTWFFEGIVVPLAEEGVFRGVILTMLLWGLGSLYSPRTGQILAVAGSTLIFAVMHLGNIGSYPTGLILFQVFYSMIFGLLFGISRVKTNSVYPAIALHAVVNLVATVG
jgi:membrane protease YdiL (CAAX protease family)